MKNEQKRSHVRLKQDATDFADVLEKFKTEYIGKSDAEKLELVKSQGEALHKQMDDLSTAMGDAFDLFSIGLLDM